MMLPAPADRGVVVFKAWPSLAYEARLALAVALVVVGLGLQAATAGFWAGVVPLLLGNLLLLVTGYDNRVDAGRFDPAAQWTAVEPERLDELVELDRRIRRWDASALDATNAGGGVLFVLLAAALGALAWSTTGPARTLALDGVVLLLPHWVTGVRSILVKPRLLVRVEALRGVLAAVREALDAHAVELLMLLQGRDPPIPDDVKFRVDVAGRHADFLGLYGQVVINEVQGASHPYFYVVLVAREGFGLGRTHRAYRAPEGITAEFKVQDAVEVLVLRQATTKTSGYHTEAPAAARILREGLALATAVAAGPPGAS